MLLLHKSLPDRRVDLSASQQQDMSTERPSQITGSCYRTDIATLGFAEASHPPFPRVVCFIPPLLRAYCSGNMEGSSLV